MTTIRKGRAGTLGLVSLGLMVLLGSCSSPADPSRVTPGTWCDALQLPSASGEPGDLIPLTGAPDNLEGVYAEVTAAGASEPVAALVTQEPGRTPAQAVLVVPIHPADPFGGGAVTLTFKDGEASCPGQTFNVAALPDPNAPAVQGTLERQAAQAQASLNQQAQALGVDPAALKGEISELPVEALSLGLAQFFVDHPDNPNALLTLAERGSIYEDGVYKPFDRDLLNSVAYQFAFPQTLTAAAELQTQALAEGCIGQGALASATHLDACMDLSEDLQALYEELALQAKIIGYAMMPLVLISPPLGLSAMLIGYTYYFINTTVMLDAQATPRALQALTFGASPTSLLTPEDSGAWSDVRVTVADSAPLDLAEVITRTIDLVNFGAAVPGLPVAKMFFDRIVTLVLNELKERFEDDINKVSVPYSSFGAVDITAYAGSYSASVVYGDELTITSPTGRTYAPSVPFTPGRADLVLAINQGYFNDSTVQGAQQITVGSPTEEDTAFVIASVDAPPVPWNGSGDVTVAWEGEGIVFPVELEIQVANCTLTECDLGDHTYEGRANPLIYPIECTTNDPTGISTVDVAFSLTDSSGKRTPTVAATLQCGGASGESGLEPSGSPVGTMIQSAPF
jgi:hypothetical protein